jgi:hypothetical protein
MEKELPSLYMFLDGFIADPDDAMDRVLKYQELSVTVEEIVRTTCLVRDRSPSASSECWRLDDGLTAHHWRAVAPNIGARR